MSALATAASSLTATAAAAPTTFHADTMPSAPIRTQRPTVFLRVKRPRSVDDDASSSADVVVRCADLALYQEASPSDTTSTGPRSVPNSGATQRLVRYTFTRVIKSATSVPSVASSRFPQQQLPPADKIAAAAAVGSPAEGSAPPPSPHVATDASNARTTAAVQTEEALFDALATLSIGGDSVHHAPPTQRLVGVKALPAAEDIAGRQLQRHRDQAVAARTSLRCERIGMCRGSNVLCIDASIVGSGSGANGSDAGVFYDLYQLETVDDEEGGTDATASECSSLSEFEGSSGDAGAAVLWAGHEDDDGIVFDDAADEFSFDVKKRHTQRDRHMRKTMRSARAIELVNIPLRNEWVQFTDRDGLQVAANSLVLDDEFPEGVDNYMYYDHRHDDEYDSNAEDRPANEYPDESDSSGSGDEDEWDACGGDHDDDGSCRRYMGWRSHGDNEEDDYERVGE